MQNGNQQRSQRGFTLIELLVVLAIIAVLVSLVSPRYLQQQDRAKETVLRSNLAALRSALDQYRADRGEDPATLEDLVTGRYLRELPLDPISGSHSSWGYDTQEEAKPGEVHSGANGKALDGSLYVDW